MEQLQVADISDENIARLTRILHRLDEQRPLTQEQHAEYVHHDWELSRATLVRNGLARTAFTARGLSVAA